jgi:hypothetical protein
VRTRFLGATAVCAAFTIALLAIAAMSVQPALSAVEGGEAAIIPAFSAFPLSAGRALGMGGVCCAIVRDPSGSQANPAATALLGQGAIVVEITQAQAEQDTTPHPASDTDAPPPDPHTRLLQYAVQVSGAPTSAEPAPQPSHWPCPGVRCSLASGHGTRWAWGVSADASATLDARYFGFGLLCDAGHGWALGARWDQVLVAGGAALSSPALGAAYDRGRWTLAADIFRATGAAPRSSEGASLRSTGWATEEASALLGAEYRLRGGIALRLGSAGGDSTYGIGYRRGRWEADIARVHVGDALLALPALSLHTPGDLTTVCVVCQF